MRNVLPHPEMLPSGASIASSECSRRHISLSIDYTGSALRGVTQAGFPVRSASLLSRPDLALAEQRRAAEGIGRSGATRSHAQRAVAPRAWRGWRAPDLPRSEHRGTLPPVEDQASAHPLRSVTSRNRRHTHWHRAVLARMVQGSPTPTGFDPPIAVARLGCSTDVFLENQTRDKVPSRV